MPSLGRNGSWLLGVVIVAVFVCVGAVVVVATTGRLWALIVAAGALVLATLAVVGDVEWTLGDSDRPRSRARRPSGSSKVSRPLRPGPSYAGPKAPHRLVVMTSEPVWAERVLAAAARCNGASASPGSLGVMVVSPEGFGKPEVTNDEGHYRSALRARARRLPRCADGLSRLPATSAITTAPRRSKTRWSCSQPNTCSCLRTRMTPTRTGTP